LRWRQFILRIGSSILILPGAVGHSGQCKDSIQHAIQMKQKAKPVRQKLELSNKKLELSTKIQK
jgi:hypothetical protein